MEYQAFLSIRVSGLPKYQSIGVLILILPFPPNVPHKINYQVVPRFFSLYSSKSRILLIRYGVYSRAAFNGNLALICGV